ncbi:MAG TPA: cyclase family protein [Roseiflexaceae bacterium]|nr:cyclase family protein [Roseiflexaceae bacterium]
MCPPNLLSAINTHALKHSSDSGAPGGPQGRPSGERPVSFRQMADLTHTLGPGSPVFAGFQPFVMGPGLTHEQHHVCINAISMWEHSGTHLDAPYHCSPEGLFIDQIPLEQLIVPAVVIDISERVAQDHDALVTVDDLRAWEQRHGRIPNNAAVLMLSGWEARIGSGETFRNADSGGVMHFPGFGKDASDFLLAERTVAGLGVDTLSLDHGASPDFAVHYSFLPTNRWGLECLANLGSIPPSGATLIIGAPKFERGSGGHTRVIAVW